MILNTYTLEQFRMIHLGRIPWKSRVEFLDCFSSNIEVNARPLSCLVDRMMHNGEEGKSGKWLIDDSIRKYGGWLISGPLCAFCARPLVSRNTARPLFQPPGFQICFWNSKQGKRNLFNKLVAFIDSFFHFLRPRNTKNLKIGTQMDRYNLDNSVTGRREREIATDIPWLDPKEPYLATNSIVSRVFKHRVDEEWRNIFLASRQNFTSTSLHRIGVSRSDRVVKQGVGSCRPPPPFSIYIYIYINLTLLPFYQTCTIRSTVQRFNDRIPPPIPLSSDQSL